MNAHRASLEKFPLINCVGLHDLEAGVSRVFANCALDAPRTSRQSNFRSIMNYRGLQHCGLLYGSYGGAFEARIGPYDTFTVGVPLSGSGEHRIGNSATTISAAGSAIIAPGENLKLRYDSTFEHFVVNFKPAPLLSKLEALIGSLPVAPLRFARAVSYDCPETLALRRLVFFLAEECDADRPAAPPLVLAELEQALMVSFLCNTQNNFSPVLRGGLLTGAPWQVRRAEEYIAANWDQPITIEALAVATNVSARSLFHSFKKTRGYSPMILVKQIRLNRAKEMLSKPGPDTSVTDVAYACGFGNLGHFANDYFRRFGERPSDTLRLSRA